MIETDARIAFLKDMHLFHGASEDALRFAAEHMTEVKYAAGETIFEQNSSADCLFFVYSGRIIIERRQGKKIITPAYFTRGDYFGEQSLFSARHKRTATAKAQEDSTLLSLSHEDLSALLKKNHKLRLNFQVAVDSRRLAQKVRFKWINPDEVIYFLARKHPIVLWRTLLGPALGAILAAFLLLWGIMLNVIPAIVLGALVFLAILLWTIWLYIDWGNDYYIVTNQRVIWLEKIIGFYDSRNESPLSTILSVGVETDMIGRMLDFGDVIVRTFVGRINFRHVNRPYQALHMIEELWQRTKRKSLQAEENAMKEAIRVKLGKPAQAKPTPAPESQAAVPSLYKPSLWKILGINLFKVRTEDGGTITYRKHWFVLFKRVWLLLVILIALLGSMISRGIKLAFDPALALVSQMPDGKLHFDALFFSIPILMLPFILWVVYDYLDWSNDIFQVTSENILDIDRKPFGTEERRSAQLENILGIEYKRIGLLGYIFNYGTVYITVGGMQMAFEDVHDPAAVQNDIDQRRVARINRTRQTQIAAERDRMAEWLAVYHRAAHEFDETPSEKTE